MSTARSIRILPYRDTWPQEFAEVRSALLDALAGIVERVDHIGSTAVPGLAAKDMIDVQIGVRVLHDARLDRAFEQLGATPTEIVGDHVPSGGPSAAPSDRSAWAKRYFRPPSTWRPTHLHVRQVDRPNFRYALLFRDYLRHCSPAAAAYGQVKVELARLHPEDTDAYYAVKDPVCDLVVQAAEEWAQRTGWVP